MKHKKNKTRNELERFHYEGPKPAEMDLDKSQSAYYLTREALLMDETLRKLQKIDYNEFRGIWKEIKVKKK